MHITGARGASARGGAQQAARLGRSNKPYRHVNQPNDQDQQVGAKPRIEQNGGAHRHRRQGEEPHVRRLDHGGDAGEDEADGDRREAALDR